MEIAPTIWSEWNERHVLDRAALHWLHEHADPGDVHPILTAVELLRTQPPEP